jgi:hypothetical protein
VDGAFSQLTVNARDGLISFDGIVDPRPAA